MWGFGFMACLSDGRRIGWKINALRELGCGTETQGSVA